MLAVHPESIVMLPICFAAELNLVYDANGNLVSGDGFTRTYNSLNQLTEVRNSTGSLLEEFSYHPTEERISFKKMYYANSSLQETVYYVDENFVRVVNSSGSYDYTYVKHEGQLVAQLNPDGSKYFIHNDHEGSTSTVTNSSGNIIETTTYSPYGEILSGGAVSRFDSEGKEHDSVVGDYDFHFRKYNPSWGLFLQPDTLIPNVYDPQSLNRYMFERGNPYGRVDPSGHIAPVLALMATGAIIGATINAGIYTATTNNFQWSGLGAYALSGAVQGGLGILNPIAAFAGGAVGEGIEKAYGGEAIFSSEGLTDIAIEGGTSTLAFGIGKYLFPNPGTHKIKYLASYFTTKTGLRFVGNQILESGIGQFASTLYSSFLQVNRQTQEQNRQGIIAEAKEGSYSGGAGYNSNAGAYITDGGKVYPTRNPNWRPRGCTEIRKN